MISLIVGLLVAGALLLYLGADSLVKGACHLALNLNVSPLIIGLTIVSIGTSLPEGVTSLMAQIKEGQGDLALSNVIGSNSANIGLICGLTALIKPLSFSVSLKHIDMPIMVGTLCILALLMLSGTIGRLSGLMLLIALSLYMIYRFKTAKETDITSTPSSKMSAGKSSYLILLGAILLILGADWFVKGAIQLAKLFNTSERVIGLTIVALGTSLPELSTTLVSAWRKHGDIAMGNIVGSNIFNSLFIVGSVSVIKPIHFSQKLLYSDAPIMIAFGLLLWVMMWHAHQVSRAKALLLLTGYCLYIASIFLLS